MKSPERPKTPEAPIIITPASAEDAAEIVKIQTETWLLTYPNEEHGITVEDIQAKRLDSPKRVERWKQRIEEADEHRVWVAKEGERVIGYVFVKKGEKENYVDALYISPNKQRSGVGQKLMDEALAWLGTSKPTGLGVAEYNEKAIAFYKKLGFEETDEPPEPVPPLPSGKTLPIIKMVKRFEQK